MDTKKERNIKIIRSMIFDYLPEDMDLVGFPLTLISEKILDALERDNKDELQELIRWCKTIIACCDIMKGGALYQAKNCQIELSQEINTLKSVLSKINRMLGVEPLLEEEWIRKYVQEDNKLTKDERLAAREKHEKEYLPNFKPVSISI